MHVSANVIRFPAQAPVLPPPSVEARKGQAPAEIVPFSSAEQTASYSGSAQEHGQIFAAHRIVARVADQLDAIATL